VSSNTKTFPRVRRFFPLVGTLGVIAAGALGLGIPMVGDVEAKDVRAESELVQAGARAETDSYIVQILPPASLTVGKETNVEITIKPKDKFHVNMQFPFKFKLAEPPPENVSFPKMTLVRADGTFTEQLGVMKLPVIAKSAGTVKIVGKLSLSVCSDANCVMDKVELEVSVDAR